MKSSRTKGVWHKSLEEAHSAKVKEKTLFGHIMCSEGTQKKIFESDLFRILESEGVTEIGALYKVSHSKFVLVFGSQTAKEKLIGTEIQCRFGESDITLNFRKWFGLLRNGKEPIFVTIYLPEHISDQAVSLAFSNFGEVVSVFKGRHNFNRKIRNGKRHVKIFPAGGGSWDTAKENFLPWQDSKGCPLCGKGGAVLQVQDSSHAWRELPCSYTRHGGF